MCVPHPEIDVKTEDWKTHDNLKPYNEFQKEMACKWIRILTKGAIIRAGYAREETKL